MDKLTLSVLLVTLTALSSAHSEDGNAISLESAAPPQPLGAINQRKGGYRELKGYVHLEKSERMYYVDRAECEQHCTDDAKCQSYSWNELKKDCIISRTAMRYNEDYSYYSRLPPGEAFGSVVGHYSVFTGLMYPSKSKFVHRPMISLEECQRMCDSDPPQSETSHERLGELVPDKKGYMRGDGCSAFSYAARTEDCLLKGEPVPYSPKYDYFVKRSVEQKQLGSREDPNEEQSHQVAETADHKLEVQKDAKDANEKEKENSEVEQEQEDLAKEAAVEAARQVNGQEKAKAKANKPVKQGPTEEQGIKEKTQKDLDKENRLADAKARKKERGIKVKVAEEQRKEDLANGIKLAAKSKEMKEKAMERKLKGNLVSLLNEVVDKAQLIAHSERGIKAAELAAREDNSKEDLVKSKVREARHQAVLSQKQQFDAMKKSDEHAGNAQVQNDAKVESEDKKEASKMTVDASEAKGLQDKIKQKLAQSISTVGKLKKVVSDLNAKLGSTPDEAQSINAEITAKESALSTEQAAKEALEQESEAQASIVARTRQEAKKADSTAAAAEDKTKSDQAAAKAIAKVKFVLVGNRPATPSFEESTLYREMAKEVGYRIPGEDILKQPLPTSLPLEDAETMEAETDAVAEATSEDKEKAAAKEEEEVDNAKEAAKEVTREVNQGPPSAPVREVMSL